MAWYNASWDHRIKVTVDKDLLGGENQTDFPVYVNLDDMPDAFHAGAKADGTDIVVTSSDGSTKLKREVAWIDTTGKKGELYFKGTLSASTDTDFYIYYGNSSGAETNDTDTWDSNFEMVHHLSAASGHFIDSTANDHDSDVETNLNYAAAGPDGNKRCVDFLGPSSLAYITIPHSSALNIGNNFSYEWWLKPATVDKYQMAFKEWVNSIGIYTNNKLYLFEHASPYGTWNGGSSTISTGNWYYIAAKMTSGNAATGFLNGAIEFGPTAIGRALAAGGTAKYAISHDNRTDATIDGLVMEVRVSKVARADSYFTSTYNNISSPSTFYTLGSEESNNTVPATPTNSSPANAATNQSRTPTLTASAFSDTDSGDTHAASQWQVATDSGFSSVVWDSGETATNKTSIVVNSTNGTFAGAQEGRTTLASNTTYYWHVRYKDSAGGWSSYS